jgi:hypothetical protein
VGQEENEGGAVPATAQRIRYMYPHAHAYTWICIEHARAHTHTHTRSHPRARTHVHVLQWVPKSSLDACVGMIGVWFARESLLATIPCAISGQRDTNPGNQGNWRIFGADGVWNPMSVSVSVSLAPGNGSN